MLGQALGSSRVAESAEDGLSTCNLSIYVPILHQLLVALFV